ncbi:MAG: UDP-glucose/GDP-mannose dehydrogenase family protein [Candidatus Marinimicrobia bacterium]|nr:UDP-glucose/GDP-mannose dehydrogenase family protein [Candidatus Neomarinimicrobiota bacterium]MDP6569068.1 UDP-glucose/GDP-mannose dehydrogenase family protein [Candidatus Neomarinimicrobiota bacterium]MDP7026431.1 UDP-glucose/GDP-mannose dehydrogenase family protein [Candidatus Neomarinimicrobiota bacterium]
MKRISVIGTGYVGLVTGAGLSDFGNNVICTDIDEDKINQLLAGDIPIYEPGLKELVDRNVSAGRLSFSTDISASVKNSEVVIIAVWTPMGDNGEADLTAVKSVAKMIGENLNGYKVICTKSTVPIGTGKKIRQIIEKTSDGSNKFDVVSNPEFLREGSAVKDFLIPNRIVIGSESEKAQKVMKQVYRPLFINETPIVSTNVVTAETIKYASNAFLAVKITYINELANLCDTTGADVHIVARGMGLDGRISPKFLHPGPGFGGSCFPKDTHALVQMAAEKEVQMQVVSAAISSNSIQWQKITKKLDILFADSLEGRTVAVLGLTFKANTDDVRQSPATPIIKHILENNGHVKAYDPEGIDNMKMLFPDIDYCDTHEEAVNGADGVIVMTEWHEFRGMDLKKVAELMNGNIIVDARNILDPKELKRNGFIFDNVGRPNVK